MGNLSVGGTGKTPHVAWLAEQYSDDFKVVILSRGYGRKTKGFRWVDRDASPQDSGDEPLLYARKFHGKVKVAVCERRVQGVQRILNEFPETNLILLDDAFQHRQIKAGLNILLTDYTNPFYNDFLLPTGSLRERRLNSRRADLIVVTKCPADLNADQRSIVQKKIGSGKKHIFFSSVNYSEPMSLAGKKWSQPKNVLLVTGIANPQPLVNQLSDSYDLVHIRFPDHHDFSSADLQQIHQKFDNFDSPDSVILTTEKDYVRLVGDRAMESVSTYPWYYIPISVEFEDNENFKSIVDQYVGTV